VRVDTSDVVLATIQDEFTVQPGETITRTLRYRDPDTGTSRISASSLVDPVAGTDYKFSATSGSGGSDLNASITITMTYGANSASAVIVNGSASTAYSQLFQLRGKGIYTYDPVESISINTTSVTAYGERVLQFQAPYQTDSNIASDFSAELLRRYKSPFTDVPSVRFSASTAALLNAAVRLDIGDRVKIIETVSGVSREYFINYTTLELTPAGVLYAEWLLEPAATTQLWILDDLVNSVLDTTTILSF
jgi:hypothetical protein